MTEFSLPDPFSLTILMVALALAPFVIIMVSSFVKIVVILNLIRNALGVQQIPPNMVINGLAIILTIYIMAPVIHDTYNALKDRDIQTKNFDNLMDTIGEAKEPIRQFLIKHSKARERNFFMNTARVMWPKEQSDSLEKTDFLVLVPAFTVTELTSAFQIGFLVYLPFITIDLIVSNILLALGMMMVSPMTISLPFKLLLFVLIEGWSHLIQGLVLSYR